MSGSDHQQTTEPVGKLALEAQRKVVRHLMTTPAGREALRMEFGLNFVFVDEAEQRNLPIVHLLMPTHSGAAHAKTNEAVQKLILFSKGKCIVVADPGLSSSCVHWVRNDLIVNLIKSKQKCDYVLFMDDDMTPPPDALVKLLAWDKDIIAGGCTLRSDPPLPNFRRYYPEEMTYRTAKDWRAMTPDGRIAKDGLIQVGAAGTGFVLIKRPVFDVIGEYYLSCRHEREWFGLSGERLASIEQHRRAAAEKSFNQWWFEFLKQPFGDGEFGEDISFSFKAMQCGYELFVDTTVRVGHVGWYGFGLDDFCGPVEEDSPVQEQTEVTA